MHLVYLAKTSEEIELLTICEDVSGHENAAQEWCQRYHDMKSGNHRLLLWMNMRDQENAEWSIANWNERTLMISNAVNFGDVLNE